MEMGTQSLCDWQSPIIIITINRKMNELPFIYEIRNKSSTSYQLQREGLQFLQSLQNKRVVLLFTVSTNINPYPFSAAFTNQPDPESTDVHFRYPLSSITISKQIQLVEPDYILIVMNYCHKGGNQKLLLVFGYLVASMMVFHNQGQLGMKSQIVQLLACLQEVVESNNYKRMHINKDEDSWEQYAKGIGDTLHSSSVPDFYCLMHNQRPSSTKNTFKNIFKDFSSSSTRQLQRSIEALNSLFFKRKTQAVPSIDSRADFLKAVESIRSDVLNMVSCKKFLGYDITGSIIKNLACQVVTLHNEGVKQINFVELRQKLLMDSTQTQKQFGISLYVKKLGYRIKLKDMPMEKQQILELHERSIRETFQEFVSTVNGMELSAFISAWKEVLQKCGDHLLHVLQQNEKAMKEMNQALMDGLSTIEIEPKVQDIMNLVSLFSYKSVGSQSKNLMCSLLQKLLKQYSQSVSSLAHDQEKQVSELKAKNLELNQRNQFLQKEGELLRLRINKCYSEKELTSCISLSREAEDKLREELIKKKTRYKATISNLQKEIQGIESKLNEQIFKRKAVEDDLFDLTDKYEHLMNKEKKTKTSLIAQLSKDLKDSIQTFERVSNKVHKMEGVYKYAKEIATENKKLSEQIQKKSNLNKQLEAEQKKLYLNIATYNDTINELQWNAECHKNNIRQLQVENGGYKVAIADMDAKIQVYGKCLKLIKSYIRTGKYEPLCNFIRLTQYEDIQGQIEELLK